MRRAFVVMIGVLLVSLSLTVPSKYSYAADYKVTDAHKALTQVTTWFNVSRPLKPEDLAGRVVLVDFWTFCCINCMHIMPDLKKLEKDYPKLTVIGVHSAKFLNEKDSVNIRSAILRYGLEHPVVNDADFLIWQAFNVQAWPTLLLINPDGEVAKRYAGEGHFVQIRQDLDEIFKSYKDKINDKPLPIALEKKKRPDTVLSFPGKLAWSNKWGLFVSDSSHDRILGLSQDGRVTTIIGEENQAGLKDGLYSAARFNKPQGLLFDGDTLYVADTDNHALRAINLKKKEVTTLASKENPHGGQWSSPWDLSFSPDRSKIWIAMAGIHQLWTFDLKTKMATPLAGTGEEEIQDGPTAQSALAQTSGLSTLGDTVYFVDAETSSLRKLQNKNVETLIGHGLFDFGYKDGGRDTALLQHPLGLAARPEGIYVADAYNHVIRFYDFKTKQLTTFAGDHTRGLRDGDLKKAEFNEPNDVIFVPQHSREYLYVADTNNQTIRVIDLKKKVVTTLDVRLGSPSAVKSEADDSNRLLTHLPNKEELTTETVATGRLIDVNIDLPETWHINDEAPSYIMAFRTADAKDSAMVKRVAVLDRKTLKTKHFNLPPLDKKTQYRLQGTLYYCPIANPSACLIRSIDRRLKPGGGSDHNVTLNLPTAH